jgi:GNAT superfamily N-acetyltransferase
LELKFLADHPNAIPVIAQWYYDEWGHKVADNSYEKTCERIRGKLNRDKAPLHIIAIEDNNVMGTAQLKIREMDIYPDREYWLGSVYITPEFRGRKIASKLCDHIVDLAKSFGIRTLYLQTEKLDGGGLYARLGWKPIAKAYYNGLDVLVMEKNLLEQG